MKQRILTSYRRHPKVNKTTKPFWKSKTLWGIGLLVASALIPNPAVLPIGMEIINANPQTILDTLFAVGGAALSIWGRKTARKRLSLK